MKASTRNSGIAGIVAGLVYLVLTVTELIQPQTEVFSGTSEYISKAVFIIAQVATIFGLIGLHSFAQNRYGVAGTIGFWLAVIGTGLTTGVTVLQDPEPFSDPAFFLAFAYIIGGLLTLIGYIVLGIMVLHRKVLPLWVGLALILGLPLQVFLGFSGGSIGLVGVALFGLAWLGVGYFLLKQYSLLDHQVTK